MQIIWDCEQSENFEFLCKFQNKSIKAVILQNEYFPFLQQKLATKTVMEEARNQWGKPIEIEVIKTIMLPLSRTPVFC